MKTKIIQIEEKKYVCEECGEEFSYESSCRRHEASHGLGYITIESKYDPRNGREHSVIIFNGKEYTSIDNFIYSSELDMRYIGFKIVEIS